MTGASCVRNLGCPLRRIDVNVVDVADHPLTPNPASTSGSHVHVAFNARHGDRIEPTGTIPVKAATAGRKNGVFCTARRRGAFRIQTCSAPRRRNSLMWSRRERVSTHRGRHSTSGVTARLRWKLASRAGISPGFSRFPADEQLSGGAERKLRLLGRRSTGACVVSIPTPPCSTPP
jgi:hypothetical protein